MPKYERSCADEVDFIVVAQLDAAVLQLSKTCADLKKLCVTSLGAAAAFLAALQDGNTAARLPAIALALATGFWLSDATAYYYQRRLRHQIAQKLNGIVHRSAETATAEPLPKVSIFSAGINGSMLVYYVIIVAMIVLLVASHAHAIGAGK